MLPKSSFLFLLVCPLFMVMAVQPEKAPIVTEYRLLHIHPGKMEEAIVANVGDMLQFQPFSHPVLPKFLDAKIKVELKGDRTLEMIGQSSHSSKEGRTGGSVFLSVAAAGQTNIVFTLMDDKGVPIPGISASYVVRSLGRK